MKPQIAIKELMKSHSKLQIIHLNAYVWKGNGGKDVKRRLHRKREEDGWEGKDGRLKNKIMDSRKLWGNIFWNYGAWKSLRSCRPIIARVFIPFLGSEYLKPKNSHCPIWAWSWEKISVPVRTFKQLKYLVSQGRIFLLIYSNSWVGTLLKPYLEGGIYSFLLLFIHHLFIYCLFANLLELFIFVSKLGFCLTYVLTV